MNELRRRNSLLNEVIDREKFRVKLNELEDLASRERANNFKIVNFTHIKR
jgi:hypothetical protein